MKYLFAVCSLSICLLLPSLTQASDNLLTNGSFETDAAWDCPSCAVGESASDQFVEVSGAVDGDRVAALDEDVRLQQAIAAVSQGKRPVRLSLSYVTDGDFSIVLRNTTTNKRYLRQVTTATKNSDSAWQTLALNIPAEAYDHDLTLSLIGKSGTTALDAVTVHRVDYPIARVTVYDSETREVIPTASVFFRTKTDHERVTLKRQTSGALSQAVTTNSEGKTPIVIVRGKPKQLQLCAQLGDAKRCTSAYNPDYFAWDKQADFAFYL